MHGPTQVPAFNMISPIGEFPKMGVPLVIIPFVRWGFPFNKNHPASYWGFPHFPSWTPQGAATAEVQAMEALFNSLEGFRPIAVRCAPRAGVLFRGSPSSLVSGKMGKSPVLAWWLGVPLWLFGNHHVWLRFDFLPILHSQSLKKRSTKYLDAIKHERNWWFGDSPKDGLEYWKVCTSKPWICAIHIDIHCL